MKALKAELDGRTVFLIGAQKAGTTFLHNALVSSGGIRPTIEKETHYFSTQLHRTARWQDMFDADVTEGVALDSSVSYLHMGETRKLIKARFEAPVIVASIRDPAQRAISAYLHNAKNGRDLRSLTEAFDIGSATAEDIYEEEDCNLKKAMKRGSIILRPQYQHHFGDRFYNDPLWTFRYIYNSQYVHQLAPYFDSFSVLLLDFRDLVASPLACVNAVRTQIGLPEADCIDEASEDNKTRISNARVARKFLRNYAYARSGRPDIHKVVFPLIRSLFQDYKVSRQGARFAAAPWYSSAGYDELVRDRCAKIAVPRRGTSPRQTVIGR